MLRKWVLAQLSPNSLCNLKQQWLLSLSPVSYTFQTLQRHPVCQSSPQSPFAFLPITLCLFVPSCDITCLLNICDGGTSSPLGGWVKIQSGLWKVGNGEEEKKPARRDNTNHHRLNIRSVVK